MGAIEVSLSFATVFATFLAALARFASLNHSGFGLTKLSKINQLIDSCSNEGTRQTLSTIREELIFKRLTGASLNLEQIQKVNEVYASGRVQHSELAAISRYLDIKKEQWMISFSKLDVFEARASFVLSLMILILMIMTYAVAMWQTRNPLAALVIPALCFPFLYFISDSSRKYRVAKRIKQDFNL